MLLPGGTVTYTLPKYIVDLNVCFFIAYVTALKSISTKPPNTNTEKSFASTPLTNKE